MVSDLFPELDAERARLAFARSSRDRMIARLEAVDPDGAADEITKEYIEVTVADALEDLRGPGAGDFFGRIDEWYIGRRHIEDDRHDPVVVDWRAPIAAPFYRATSVDPLGVAFRRRFTLDDGDIVAYLDEHLDDPDEGEVAGGIPDPVLAEIGAERSGEMREIVSTIQAEQDIVIRAPIDQVLVVQGGPGTGKTAVALHRAAYLLFEHRGRLARDGVLVVGPNQAFLDYIANVLPSLGERSVRQATVDELCIPRVELSGEDDVELARWKGDAARLDDLDGVGAGGDPPARRRHPDSGRRTNPCDRSRSVRRLAGDREVGHQPAEPASGTDALVGAARAPPTDRVRGRVDDRRRRSRRRSTRPGRRRSRFDSSIGCCRDPRASGGAGPVPTNCSSTRRTRCSTGRRSPTAT